MTMLLSMFSMVPKKLWMVLGIIAIYLSSVYFANTSGKKEGYLKAERDFNKASLEAIEGSMSDLNLRLSKALEKQEDGLVAMERLSEKVSLSNTVHNKSYQEMLNEAKKNTSSGDCDKLSGEYVRLFQSIYPKRE